MATDVRDTSVPTGASAELDRARVEAFAAELFGLYTGGMLTYMIDIGRRTGLFAAAAEGPATSDELAARAGLVERYVHEWLGAMVTGGLFQYDPVLGLYRLPAEHAACLTGVGADDLTPLSRLNTHLAQHVGAVARAFREGGGVPYEAYRPEFTEVMDCVGRGVFDDLLVGEWLPLAPGLPELLAAGARVADVGCGTGHALVLLARAFPASTFVGYDIAVDAIDAARAEAAEAGTGNVAFEVCDVAALAPAEPFDAVLAFDAIHDQVAPDRVLRRVHDALLPGGTFLMVDTRASSRLEDNLDHPLAPFLYSVSTLHCMTISLAHGGAGLGTMWGEQQARRLLEDAGLEVVAVRDAPGDPINSVYVTRRPAR